MDVRLAGMFSAEENERFAALRARRADPATPEDERGRVDVQLQEIFLSGLLGTGRRIGFTLAPRNLPATLAANDDFLAFRNSGELARALTRIAVPVRAIHGDRDPIPVHGVIDVLRAHVSRFEGVVLSGSAHFPWLEPDAATRFLPALERFLT
jgi:pimeloyl-ACP methyl ester carboxylesterase